MTNNTTDTNQASEDIEKALFSLISDVASETERYIESKGRTIRLPMKSRTAPILELIRTEKLKLLAEVRERMVGEDEVSKARLDKLRQSPPWQRNQLRNDQRIELTKLEAEL